MNETIKTHTISGVYPGVKLKGKTKYSSLYHFTSFDTFVKIWLTKVLRFSPTMLVNDIQEVRLSKSCSVCNMQQLPFLSAFNDIRPNYKQISLSMDKDSYMKGCMNTMMWGHYGDKGNGVCIELDFEKLNLPNNIHCFHGQVRYVELMDKACKIDPSLKTLKGLKKFFYKKRKAIFFTKHIGWKQEDEYRIISDELQFIDISKAIKCIYVTDCDSCTCMYVEELVKNAVPIQFIKYISTKDNKAIPILLDTKSGRENEDRKFDPNNSLNKLALQAEAHYLNNKNDESTCLLKAKYTKL